MKLTTISLARVILPAYCLVLLLSASVFAQSSSREKPKLKDFGKSLKRLKWDSKRNETVEIEDKSEQQNAVDDETIRVETMLVVSDLLVLNEKGFSVQGLSKQDFIVTEDGNPQEIGSFSLGDDANVPRSIVLIIDSSSGLVPDPGLSVEAAKNIVNKLRPRDRMAIVTDRVKLLSDFTSDKMTLKNKLESYRKEIPVGFEKGASMQYSALLAVLRELFDVEDIRPIVILQADGDELLRLRPIAKDVPEWVKRYPASFGLKEIYAAVEKSRATVYVVNPGFRLIDLPADERSRRVRENHKRFPGIESGMSYWLSKRIGNRIPTSGEKAETENYFVNQYYEQLMRTQPVLEDLSKLTGGWTEYLEAPSKAEEIYTRILTNIDNRYVIGYYPANTERDGKRRRVKIEVRNHPEYTVVGRKTYFAPSR